LAIDLSDAGTPSAAHNNIITILPSASLTGSANNTPTPNGANDPGLESAPASWGSSGGNMKSQHWLMIGLIVLVLLGLWYYYGGSAASAA